MHIVMDPSDKRALPVRIADAIRTQISTGILAPGEPLDSTRAIAEQLGISRGSVVSAFEQLIAEGYLTARRGSGTQVNPQLPHPHIPEPAPAPMLADAPASIRLTPGLPDTTGIITSEWRAAWREAASHPLGQDTSLPQEIAAHLRHMRGLDVNPQRIVVTAGARDGLTLLLRALESPLTVGVESPGYPSLRRIPAALGHTVVEVPTDAHGVTTPDALDALIVTPSHQYPYGASLPAARRVELVDWARRHGAVLIEDDFDSELRYVGQPLPALAALAPDDTVLLGTFSSVISPSIACGYLVVPERLLGAVNDIRSVFGQPVGAIPQAALAHYLASGALRRHTGRMRRAYKRRRNLVHDMLADAPATLLPINGGLHAVLLCDESVVERAARRGLTVTPLHQYWGGTAAEEGIVVGFGHLSDAELTDALTILRGVLDETPAG